MNYPPLPLPPPSILSSEGTEGEELFTVTLCGSIQDRRLQLLDCHTPSSMLEHVAFGHTYYGTTITRKVLEIVVSCPRGNRKYSSSYTVMTSHSSAL